MKKYQEPLAKLKAKAQALASLNRHSQGYMSNSELCDDVNCNLCYKFKGEKAIWNK